MNRVPRMGPGIRSQVKDPSPESRLWFAGPGSQGKGPRWIVPAPESHVPSLTFLVRLFICKENSCFKSAYLKDAFGVV